MLQANRSGEISPDKSLFLDPVPYDTSHTLMDNNQSQNEAILEFIKSTRVRVDKSSGVLRSEVRQSIQRMERLLGQSKGCARRIGTTNACLIRCGAGRLCRPPT